jgi:ankyrin repeat protein
VQPKNPFNPVDVFDAYCNNDIASLCRLLFSFGTDAVLKADLGFDAWTGLHLATNYGFLAIVKLLLESGAEIDITNDGGEHPSSARPATATWM